MRHKTVLGFGVTLAVAAACFPSSEDLTGEVGENPLPLRDAGTRAREDAEPPDAGGPEEPKPTCTDGVKNGDETDIDCGGLACLPCAKGMRCTVPKDCADPDASTCQGTATGDASLARVCCRTYLKTTGQVSSSGQICCDAQDVRASYRDCAIGDNHSASATEVNCAKGVEGEANNGSACAEVGCLDCAPAKADAG